jgi:alkylhydroperoxidase/carboxymuconolactone decarboxylase family protein YurZ
MLEAVFSVVRAAAVVMQWRGKHVSEAMNQHSTIEELLETVFSVVRAAAVVMQWRGKYVSGAMNQHSTIEELLETAFCTRSPPRGYQWDKFRV